MYLPPLFSDQRFRILIVEDDPAIVRIVALQLKMSGLDVFVARDGLEAWHQLSQINPHLILADIKMPRLSGFQLVSRVRHASAVPILLMGGDDSEETQVQGFKMGADDFIAKPFTPERLTMRVVASLRRAYKYNGSAAQSMSAEPPVYQHPAAPRPTPQASTGLPRGFVRCDSCNYVGPVRKFEARDTEGNMVASCPCCHNKNITFALA